MKLKLSMKQLVFILTLTFSGALFSCTGASTTTATATSTEKIDPSSSTAELAEPQIEDEMAPVVESTEKENAKKITVQEKNATKNSSSELKSLTKEVEPMETKVFVEAFTEEISKAPKTTTELLKDETTEKQEEAEKHSTPNSPHENWNTLLKKYVDSDGNVNYAGFKNDYAALKGYVDALGEKNPTTSWNKNQKLAYYINLYNATTVLLIVDNYPTKSIKDIPNRWKKEWIKVGNGITSLNDIEHKMLRKMNEPRIHFAINCASYSCPQLLNTAFTADNMERLLEKAAVGFINDSKRNRYSDKGAEISKIFKWFKSDFTQNSDLLGYLNKYVKTPLVKDTDISYLDYDWSLNDVK